MAQIRLDKYLADAGCGTRSQIKQELKSGIIQVNGSIIKKGDIKINPEQDEIFYNGKQILREDFVYYIFNKPAGCVSATKDNIDPTVLDYIQDSTHKDLFPVGRLDKDTEGLLLITNDGALSHRLLSPKRHVEKTYYLETDLPIPQTAIEDFKQGVDIGEPKPTLPSHLELINDRSAYLTIYEGKFHQVKRMLATQGCTVTYLQRIRMGSLLLDTDLALGEYRKLTAEELTALQNYESPGK